MLYQDLSLRDKLKFKVGAVFNFFNKKQVLFQTVMNQYAEIAKISGMGYTIEEDDTHLKLKSEQQTLFLRKQGSDKKVFEQILVQDEYKLVINILQANNAHPAVIIDAGSNIGLTSIKLKEVFPDCQFICLEPDPENFRQLKSNLAGSEQCILVQKALWDKEEHLFISTDFLDGEDWSKSVSKNPTSDIEVEGISLNALIAQHDIEVVDFLKIDIEGSEAVIFKPENDLSFLKKVRMIAIEIHDVMECRASICEVLRKNNFLLLNSGELTIGLNRTLM